MKYLSVCSGIEAASVAWHSIGWEPLAFSEIEPFPRAVLAHHYPDVPCHGDFTKLCDEPWIVDADVLVGGTPCQAFSVAGLRKSLDDDRGNLSLEFVRLADAIDNLRTAGGRDPSIIVWENVPGVLSVKDNAFGCFLAGLAGDVTSYVPPRGKWTNAGVVDGPQRQVAWRVLDAQYFGLAQRRRRVFVVASARNGFDPAAVLFECEGVRRDTPPRREKGQIAPTIPSRSTAGGGLGTDFDLDGGVIRQWPAELAPTLNAASTDLSPTLRSLGAYDANGGSQMAVAFAQNTRDEVRLQGGDGQIVGALAAEPGTKQQTYVAQPTAYAFQPRIARNGCGDMGEVVNALNAQSGETGKGDAAPCVAVAVQSIATHDVAGTMMSYAKSGGNSNKIDNAAAGYMALVPPHMAVRRLTPTECERLQGFPDDYTMIPWKKKPAEECPDGPRYKALGNSMAVPCMRWIGRRISDHLCGNNLPKPGNNLPRTNSETGNKGERHD